MLICGFAYWGWPYGRVENRKKKLFERVSFAEGMFGEPERLTIRRDDPPIFFFIFQPNQLCAHPSKRVDSDKCYEAEKIQCKRPMAVNYAFITLPSLSAEKTVAKKKQDV
ncbi:hypothetical protein EVAR_4259_1 [Eumeta japonica]|uniref:Uncharacterized protein n=1 Tax=Eumeta variegata TaxID=151549 RepID=A0A4C1ZB00_EUMVA|nr:hypothetical protein EVAR_4259_1 [Eumeta japonica]